MGKISTGFVIVSFIMLISQQLFAGGGRLAGIVTDATTNEPLSGANVFLEGTSIGTATDLEGGYIITNIPAGSYQLSVVYIGYESVTQSIEIVWVVIPPKESQTTIVSGLAPAIDKEVVREYDPE